MNGIIKKKNAQRLALKVSAVVAYGYAISSFAF
jgi:hypothetical protein